MIPLLRRLLSSQDIDALLGDITEEARRRSRIWYWSQLLAVVVIASWKGVRARKGLALGAIATGFGFQMAVGSGLLFIRITLRQHWHVSPEIWSAIEIAGDVAIGWWLVSLFRPYGITMLVAFRAAMLGFLLIVSLWSASVYAIHWGTAFMPILTHDLRHALGDALFESMLMFVGGFLASRRMEFA